MTTLDGVDPNDPTPISRRQILLGASAAGGTAKAAPILLFVNKASAGTEPVETIGDPIAGQADADARLGSRSTGRWTYSVAREMDPDATIYVCCIAEASGGTAATVVFSFGATNADVATAQQTVDVRWAGRQTTFVVNVGDTTAVQVANAVLAISAADSGTWAFTVAQGSTTNSYKLTATCANVGDRGVFTLNSLTITPRGSTGNDITKASVANGTGSDDCTLALAAADTAGEFRFQATEQTSLIALTATDNNVGEHIAKIQDWFTASNGRNNELFVGLVGTQTQGTTVTTSAGANSALAHFIRSKNSPWMPGMIAAYHAALWRKSYVVYPSDNINGYSNSDSTPYRVPAPYAKSDWPTAAEIKADLNNGICPIKFLQNGAAVLVRFITSRSLNTLAQTDYNCREGHIPSASMFSTEYIMARYAATKQKNAAADPPSGQMPVRLFTYPQSVRTLIASCFAELCSGRLFGNIVYPSAILDPGSLALMRDSLEVDLTTSGGTGFLVGFELRAVQHNNKIGFKASETSPAQ